MKNFIFTCLLICFAAHSFAAEDKYNFIFFYKEENQKTNDLKSVFEDAMKKEQGRATGSIFQINEEKAKQYIQRYSLKHAPMPFVLVLAPNGAIMGGFPTHFTEEQLLSSFSTPVIEKCLKGLQDHKLVILCSQNAHTRHNNEAMEGVNAFKADPKYGNATEVIALDPQDSKNQQFLKQLSIEPNPTEASTIFLAPPADVVGNFTGPTTKEQFTTAINQATQGCCPGGCCPGGCCPGGKCCP